MAKEVEAEVAARAAEESRAALSAWTRTPHSCWASSHINTEKQ